MIVYILFLFDVIKDGWRYICFCVYYVFKDLFMYLFVVMCINVYVFVEVRDIGQELDLQVVINYLIWVLRI